MSLKRKLAIAVASAAMIGLLPIGGPASAAAKCDTTTQLFFYYGAKVADRTVSNGVSANMAVVGCIASEESGADIDLFYVYPGALLVTGRDNNAVCRESFGSINGLGVNASETWKPPSSCVDGTPTVGTGGAGSPVYMLDPTQVSGFMTATASGGSIQYRTIDR